MDIQECPTADMAIITLVIETIKALVSEKFASLEEQMKVRTEILAGILDETAQHGQEAKIYTSEYLALFGIREFATARDVWTEIFNRLLRPSHTSLEKWKPELEVILKEGTLADRILKAMEGNVTRENILRVYRKLSWCLAQNKIFVP